MLAIDGGAPLRTAALPAWPVFAADEIEAAASVLRSGKVNYWTGEEGRNFEREYAAFTGCRYAVAVSSGSVALELALVALGVGPGDEVIVPARSFIASASCVAMRGAQPVFADVDRNSQTLTAATVEPVITPRTRAIIAVHLAGHPCDMDPLLALASQRGVPVIEDCAQAHGATYKGHPVGSMGAVGAFSFCQDKIMSTCGEGGMITTNNETLWHRAWSFKENGKNHDAVYAEQHPPGFRWLHESIGTNWRMTEMQAAIGRVLLRKIPERVKIRRRYAAMLNDSIGQIPGLRVTVPATQFGHAYYKYYVFVRPEALASGWTRDRIMQVISAEGIPCYSGSCGEIYLEKAFPEGWSPATRLPVARELGETSLMFLVHQTLTEADILDTCRAVHKVMAVAAGNRSRGMSA
jgi:dTDP-4-amino-4,6-dideoxygalactose transaminase